MSETPAFHHLSAEAALTALACSRHGLSGSEAAERLARHGPNRLPEPRRRGPLRRLLAQFENMLVLVLIAAAGVTAVLGHWVDTGVILAVVIVNALIGFLQEGRAEQAMAAIRVLLAPRAAVLRDGLRATLPGAALVPGDIVLLEAGDRVPADLRLLSAHGLTVQEAILTGESLPVEKRIAAVPSGAVLGDRACMAYSGTLVTRGSGRGVVVATGPATEIGRIGGLLSAVEELSTPLVRQMAEFGRLLSGLILAGAGLLLLFGSWLGHLPFAELFMAVVGLAVAAIPEGLPAVMTITLAIGVQAMARRNAIVRRLPAIEAIGAISVICTDKTGTLTRNEMAVVQIETPLASHAIDGEGYAPEGRIHPRGDLRALARAAALCNDAALRCGKDGWSVEGDPMEGALLAFAGKVEDAGCDGWTRRDVLPFDARHRFMAVLCVQDERAEIQLKGAPEAVLALCAQGPSGARLDRAAWEARANAMAAEGQRVLAVARADGHGIADLAQEGWQDRLEFLGLAGLIDPPRPEAVAALAECRSAGIAVKMITGDHAGTAAAIAARIGLDHPDRVLTGADLDRMDDDALAEAARHTHVFARTSPEDKLRLVEALQAQGLVVAMTGDGVNDAPALKRADAGVAMGLKGSEAAKEAADLVLADDNFATIVAAVREGRTVQDNLRKVIRFELPTSMGEALTIVIALLAGLALPITAVQILWVNLITGVTLGLALAFEPTEPATMTRPPRRRDAALLTPGLAWHVAFVSLLFVAAVFGVFAWAQAQGASLARAQTLALNMLVVLEAFHLLFVRRIHGSVLSWSGVKATPVVWTTVAIIILAQVAITTLPAAQAAFGTEALSLPEVAALLAVGLGFLLVLEAERRLRWSLRR